MKVGIFFEHSGIVRNAFTAQGHDAFSCDILPSLSPGKHFTANAFEVMYSESFDLGIFHPPCTFLCKAQLWKCNLSPERKENQLKAIEDFKKCLYHPCNKIAVENPIGILSSSVRPYDQLIQPWMFGDPYKKEICLWLKNLPPLISTLYNPLKKSVSNHVNGRMSQDQRSLIRSRFFPNVAKAMAIQWS